MATISHHLPEHPGKREVDCGQADRKKRGAIPDFGTAEPSEPIEGIHPQHGELLCD
jgi:hypothetical protein